MQPKLAVKSTNPSITKTNNTFLNAAKYQHDYFNTHSVSQYSCFSIDDGNKGIPPLDSSIFYTELYNIRGDTFNDKLARLQKKHVDKISKGRLNEIRVLALLFAHHIYNDTKGC